MFQQQISHFNCQPHVPFSSVKKTLERHTCFNSGHLREKVCSVNEQFYFLCFSIREQLFYNIVMYFAIHQHESALGIYIYHLLLEPPTHIHPYPTLLGCHRVLSLSSSCHALISCHPLLPQSIALNMLNKFQSICLFNLYV